MGDAVSAIDAAPLAIGARWVAFKDSLTATQKLLWAGMKSVTTTGLADQETALTAFTDSWKNVKLPAFRDAVIDLANQIKDGVLAKMQEIIDGVMAKIDEMISLIASEDNLAEAYDAGASIGEAVAKGIADGMTNEDANDALSDAANAIIDMIEDLIEDAADIASPSKRLAEAVGLPLTQGITMGMVSAAADKALLNASNVIMATTTGYMAGNVPSLPMQALRNIGASRLPGISGGESIVMHNEVRREYPLAHDRVATAGHTDRIQLRSDGGHGPMIVRKVLEEIGEGGYELSPARSIFALIAPEASTNIVTNPECINLVGYTALVGTVLVSDDDVQKRGVRSIRCDWDPAHLDGELGLIYTLPAVLGEGDHTFSVDIHGRGEFSIWFGDANGVPVDDSGVRLPGVWSRPSITTYSTGSGIRTVGVKSYDGESFWVDGFQVEQKSYSTTFISGNVQVNET